MSRIHSLLRYPSAVSVELVILDDEDALRVMGHYKVLKISRLLLTLRDEVLRRQWSEATESDLFVTDVSPIHCFYGEDIQNSMHVIKIDS
jgi:hypothetical protein